MKKLPLLLLTAFTAVCLTFSATACDDVGGDASSSDNSSANSAASNGSGSVNSGLVSDKLTSLEEWEAAFDGSNYNNFTADVTYTYDSSTTKTYSKASDSSNSSSYPESASSPEDTEQSDSSGSDSTEPDIESFTVATATSSQLTTESYNVSSSIIIDGTAEYNFTKGDYVTGTYGSTADTQQTSTINGITTDYTEKNYKYRLLTDSTEYSATKTEQNGQTEDIWGVTRYTADSGRFTPETTCANGYIIDNFDNVSLSEDKLTIWAFNNGGPIYGLFVASYTDEYSDYYDDTCVAAEYKDDAYYCRYGVYPTSDGQEQIKETADSYEYEQYCDCYVKVNDGHVSYIKLEYTYILNYETTGSSSITISSRKTTRTIEYSFYDFGTTAVTVPGDVTALFE